MSPGVGVFGITVTAVELMAVFVGYQYGVTQWQPGVDGSHGPPHL